MNKWEVMGHSFEDIGSLLLTECENMATNCNFDPGFEQMYEHYEIMLRTLTTQHGLIQDAFNMLDTRFSGKDVPQTIEEWELGERIAAIHG